MAATGLLTHVWGTVIKDELGTQRLGDTQTITGTNVFNESILVPAGQVGEIDCGSLDKTKMVSLFLSCSSALTVFTNAADGSGGQSISLGTNRAWGWNSNMPGANPISANITKIFVDNTSGTADATFKASFLMNLLA